MIKNYLLIIGAMKCGTTTLYETLSKHPQISSCLIKESGFFAFDEIFERGFSWYEKQFNFDSSRHAYALEASTDYTKFPYCNSTSEKLAASKPRQFKLIYVIRNPLRRIESHARHAQFNKKEIGQQPSERPDHSLDFGISPVSLAMSDYALQLDQYESYFDQGDLLLVTLEDLSRQPSLVLRQICEFLGIHVLPNSSNFYKVNTTNNMRRPHPLWEALASSRFAVALAKTILPKNLRHWLKDAIMIKYEVQGRYKLNPEEEQAILEKLVPGLLRLSSHYGIDVEKKWGIKL